MAHPTLTAAELYARVVEYRRFHSMGGPLHVVLDDQNIESHFIEWCLANTDDWYRDWYHPEYQEQLAPIEDLMEMTKQLGADLLAASKTQRLKACRY